MCVRSRGFYICADRFQRTAKKGAIIGAACCVLCERLGGEQGGFATCPGVLVGCLDVLLLPEMHKTFYDVLV